MTTAPPRRAFAAGDVLRLLLGLAVVALGVVAAEVAQATVTGFERDLLRAQSLLPDRVERVVLLIVQVSTSLVPLVAAIVLLLRRRWRVALVLLVASTFASAVMVVADALVLDHDLVAIAGRLAATSGSVTGPGYPSSRELAATTAVVTVAAPWLTRSWKRALWSGVAALGGPAADRAAPGARPAPGAGRRHRCGVTGAAGVRLAVARAAAGRARPGPAGGGCRPRRAAAPRGRRRRTALRVSRRRRRPYGPAAHP